MTAPQAIIELVERFERNRDDYKSGKYNETQARREFVDPMFKALGWDVDNEQGYAEAYKDVIHEAEVKVEGKAKAPDYSFRIGGTRKFFVEAKKPSVFVKEDIAPAFQVRRYGWSAKLPLSLVTDFEEFAVYDCRIKPVNTDKASTARIMYLTYDQYAEHWDEIAGVFSRDAILKGSFDRFADSAKGKRGTAEVDAEFLKEIEKWRDKLARDIALRNRELSQGEINYAVQMTIDRLIFLRICEDRGIEPYQQLHDLLKAKGVYGRLCGLFQQADERYNSGLFHFREEKGRGHADGWTLGLGIDDDTLVTIIRGLYYPTSPYEFSVMPASVLGQVYEQFLGKVIRLTAGHRASVEDKPEVKKAGGVYYTPDYIVEYIVKNTVGKLLEGKTPAEVAPMRILDPACGSGSFLIGAYQTLLDWHLDWYMTDGAERHTGEVYQAGANNWRLTTGEKKRILVNNIYGVDIDAQAVEVTKLSLLLKVLEGETQETIGTQMRLFKERALPDLGSNVKCGNSLIGYDFFDPTRPSGHPPLARGGQGGVEVSEEERARINAFDWASEFPEATAAGGFDAVIGNPPYGATLTDDERSYLETKYPLQQYQPDTYLIFIEKALSILNGHCLLGMIIPNTWLLNLASDKIRDYLLTNSEIVNVVHYRYRVFRQAAVDTEIVIIRNSMPHRKHNINISVVNKNRQVIDYFVPQTRWIESNGKPINVYERTQFVPLASKMQQNPRLDSLCKITQGTKPFQVGKGNPPQTQAIVDLKPFVSATRENETFRPLLRGSLMGRYEIRWDNNYWISLGDWLAEPRYSAQYDAPQKIAIRQTGYELVAVLDRSQFVVRDNLYTIVSGKDLNIELTYVLGILNSRLMLWYYQNIVNPEQGEALAQVKRGHLAQLPIATIDASDSADVARHDNMVALVDRMLDLNKKLAGAKTPQEQTGLERQIAATDGEIDRLVYGLYGLTEEEIAIVEGG